MNKLLVILGPTSTGKTDIALGLAKRFNGELISCDSRQIYKGLDIGTGKMPGKEVAVKKGKGFWEIDGVNIWMYDLVDPRRQYSVADYVKDAEGVIEKILEKGRLPIIVGGTGLYLKALLEGLPNLAIPLDTKLRRKLEQLSLQQLQEKLQALCPERWGKMNDSDRQNPRRLIRAIELVLLQPRKVRQHRSSIRNLEIFKISLTAPRKVLYERIDKRVVDRINQGMLDEAESLHKSGLSFKRMRQLGLEYGVMADYLENKIKDKKELVQVLQGKIHGYARRQITWFKKEQGVSLIDITDPDYAQKVEKEVAKWYYQANDT